MLDSRLILRRMRRQRLSLGELALQCQLSETQLSSALAGQGVLRPVHLLRLSLALRLRRHRLLQLPAPQDSIQVAYVGLSGLPSAAVRERAAEGNQLLCLSQWLPAPSLTRLQATRHDLTDVAALAHRCRALVGRSGDTGLHTCDFLALLRFADVAVTPSLRGDFRREHWTTVTRLSETGQLVVHWPILASSDLRLVGLARALGTALTLHCLPAVRARRFGELLADELLGPSSCDDLAPKVTVGDTEQFVASSRACGLGLVMDAVEQFQVHVEQARNHAFVSNALRTCLVDAIGLSGELYPAFKENVRRGLASHP